MIEKGAIVTNTVFVVGMAGSGKSSLTAAYSEWLKETDQDVLVANFDPGATALPYNPDIDARQYVDIEKLMLDYKLGPNGALIMASDLLADNLEDIRGEINDANPEMLIVDTPGQIELFAFREGGRFIANQLTEEGHAILYLMDAPFAQSPLNFISNIYLAAAIYSRIAQPQVYALSKADLLSDSEVDDIVAWATEREAFEESLRKVREQDLSMISRNLANAVFDAGLLTEPIPVSSKDNSGMVELNAAITRVLTAGEEQSS
jgi:GTPase SAR1 family protein